MKKVLALLLVSVMFLCSLTFVGCKDKTQVIQMGEICYVSVYEEKKEQKENGEVIITGYELYDEAEVKRSKMYALPYGEQYEYSGLGREVVYAEEVMYLIPKEDCTIFIREKENKRINFFYKGINVTRNLNVDELEQFNATFIDTYEENFSLSANQLIQMINYTYTNDVMINLYTDANKLDEPFAKTTLYKNGDDWYGTINFSLIQTTNVYISLTTIYN